MTNSQISFIHKKDMIKDGKKLEKRDKTQQWEFWGEGVEKVTRVVAGTVGGT